MARGCRRRDNANQRRDLGRQTRDVVLHNPRRVVPHLQVSRTLAGRSRTLGEKALLQGLEPGVGLVSSRRRPVNVPFLSYRSVRRIVDQRGSSESTSLDPGAPGEGRDRKARSG